jgi:AcrR family transcriptional regulator
MMREAHEDVLERMREAAEGITDPHERLTALVRAHVRFHAERYTAARVANHELPALGRNRLRVVLALRAEIERLVAETLEDGQRAGSFSVSDVRAVTFLILSIGIGVSRWFDPTGRLSGEELGDLYAELVGKMVV